MRVSNSKSNVIYLSQVRALRDNNVSKKTDTSVLSCAFRDYLIPLSKYTKATDPPNIDILNVFKKHNMYLMDYFAFNKYTAEKPAPKAFYGFLDGYTFKNKIDVNNFKIKDQENIYRIFLNDLIVNLDNLNKHDRAKKAYSDSELYIFPEVNKILVDSGNDFITESLNSNDRVKIYNESRKLAKNLYSKMSKNIIKVANGLINSKNIMLYDTSKERVINQLNKYATIAVINEIIDDLKYPQIDDYKVHLEDKY